MGKRMNKKKTLNTLKGYKEISLITLFFIITFLNIQEYSSQKWLSITARRIRDVDDRLTISESDIELRKIYFVRDGNLYDGFGNLVAERGKFIVRYELGDIKFLFGARVEIHSYGFLVDEEGNLWQGPRNRGKAEFIGEKGYLIYDGKAREPLIVDGKYVLGNYTGIDLQRDLDTPLFDEMPEEAKLKKLLEYTGPNREPIGVIIDLDTDPPGNYVDFAEIMATNPDIVTIVPYLDIHRPGQSLYLKFEDIARRGLMAVLQADWAIHGGQSAGKFVTKLREYIAAMMGTTVEGILTGEWESGNEVLMPNIRSEDLHETAAVGEGIVGAYAYSYENKKAEFPNNRIPDELPVLIFRQLYITSEGELDMDMLFRPYTENYKDDAGNIQDNLLMVFIDDTEDVNLKKKLKEGIQKRTQELGVEDKIFYFHREKDPAWRGIEEGYMRKVGRVMWMSYFLSTQGQNTGKMYTAPKYDMRERDSQGRMWLSRYFYVGPDNILYYWDGTPVRRGGE